MHRAASSSAGLEPEQGRGLVVVAGPDERLVAHASYIRESADRAEVAFEVADDWHGHGIATVLLAHLAALAASDGIATFTAVVLPENHRMVRVFRDSGFAVDVRSEPGELHVEMPAALGDDARVRFEDRERVAAAAAAAHVLRPASVAVIGVSRKPGSIGAAVLGNLRAAGYRGRLAVVHPRGGTFGDLTAHHSIADVPEPVELAVVAVKAEAVVEVARECGAAGVRALVVLSAGFAEVGAAGVARQAELLAVCRAAGMRLVGPNCLGVLNTAADVGLNASFAPVAPTPGHVAFASQSGAFGIAAVAEAARRGLGLSSFVSTGNKADLSGNDLLQYWEGDPGTDVIGLYLESFGNPRRFGRIARRVGATKPVIAVKSGRSAAGARAAASHTAALVAVSDATVDALFRHAGVIRAGTVGELFDVAALLSGQPLPGGDRIGVVTNAGGPGISCADACAAAGLRVDPVGERTRGRLAAHLPPEATVTNPVDMIASAGADDYRRALEVLAEDPAIDALVAIFIPPLVTAAQDVAEAMRAAAVTTRAAGKPLVAVWMAQDDASRALLAGGDGGVPAFGTPEEAVRALAHAVGYARWRRAASETPPVLDGIDADAASAAIAAALAEGGGWLPPDQVADLLSSYGVPQVAARVAPTADAVVELRRGARRGAGRDQGDRSRARPQVRRGGRPPRRSGARRRCTGRARDRGGGASRRPRTGRLRGAGDGRRGRRAARRRRGRPRLRAGRGLRRRRRCGGAARRRPDAPGAADPPRRGGDGAVAEDLPAPGRVPRRSARRCPGTGGAAPARLGARCRPSRDRRAGLQPGAGRPRGGHRRRCARAHRGAHAAAPLPFAGPLTQSLDVDEPVRQRVLDELSAR